MSHRGRKLLTVVLVALAASLARPDLAAADGGTLGSMFSFGAFGTFGVVHSSTDQADFVGGFFQPNGAGYTHSWSAGVDSKLGLQMNAHFNQQLSAVVQVAVQHQYDNSYRPDVEWANLKYQITPDVSVRVGRTVSSLFMVSDSGLVGYANPWVRPPLEVYGNLPIDHTDGIDGAYRLHSGAVTNWLRASYGQFSTKTPAGGEARATHIADISDTVEYGPGSVRVGYLSSHISLSNPGLDSLFDGLAQLGDTLSAIPGQQTTAAQARLLADTFRTTDVSYSIITAGATYDPGTWLVMAEWCKTNAAAAIPNSDAGYITAGYRVDQVTPFLTLARDAAHKPTAPPIQAGGLPLPLAAVAAALNGGLDAVIEQLGQSDSDVSVGVRWDFVRSAALKLQFDHLMLGTGSTGRLANVQPGLQPGSDLNLFSLTVDFVL